MSKLTKLTSAVAAAGVGLAMLATPIVAQANEVHIKVQAVLGTQTTEVKMLRDFMDDVTALTGGDVTFEVLPAGAVVGVKETLDAVDAGLVDGGFAWTHYWSGKHPAAMLFGSPVAGAGVGIDNIAFVSWFQFGGGKELYDQLWDEMNLNVKGFMLQPVGPEALGWFKEPINSMEDFRKYRFRTPPGLPGQTYKDIGVASVAMGGGDILPALEKGTIDAAEWCCPKPDMDFGFHKVLKHISPWRYVLKHLVETEIHVRLRATPLGGINGAFFQCRQDITATHGNRGNTNVLIGLARQTWRCAEAVLAEILH